MVFAGLLRRSLRHRKYRYESAAFSFGTELHATLDESKQRMILADPNILAGVPLGASLARKNITGEHDLAAVLLHAKPPARAVATVA